MAKQKRGVGLSSIQREALRQISLSKSEYIIGIDEVGMGCWAGPVVVAGVVLPKAWLHEKVIDSKQYGQRREMMKSVLFEVIYPATLARDLAFFHANEVDEMGVEGARNALTQVVAEDLRRDFPDAVVVQDGLDAIAVGGSLENVVVLPKADVHVPAVSAASILAKVSRDIYMLERHKEYPDYGFDTNVGYHSLKHKLALERRGATPLHRLSFRPVRRILNERSLPAVRLPKPLTATLQELVNS